MVFAPNTNNWRCPRRLHSQNLFQISACVQTRQQWNAFECKLCPLAKVWGSNYDTDIRVTNMREGCRAQRDHVKGVIGDSKRCSVYCLRCSCSLPHLFRIAGGCGGKATQPKPIRQMCGSIACDPPDPAMNKDSQSTVPIRSDGCLQLRSGPDCDTNTAGIRRTQQIARAAPNRYATVNRFWKFGTALLKKVSRQQW